MCKRSERKRKKKKFAHFGYGKLVNFCDCKILFYFWHRTQENERKHEYNHIENVMLETIRLANENTKEHPYLITA